MNVAREVLFRASVSKPSAGVIVGILAALAIVGAVAFGLNLFIGEAQLPRELRGTTPWFGLATAVLSAITGYFWWRGRRALSLVVQDGLQVLEIDDRPPVVLAGPFDVRLGWTKVAQPKGPAMTLLQVVFVDGDSVPLVLTEYWGALYGAPDWPEGLVTVGTPAKAAYSPSGTAFLTKLVDQLERQQR